MQVWLGHMSWGGVVDDGGVWTCLGTSDTLSVHAQITLYGLPMVGYPLCPTVQVPTTHLLQVLVGQG